ncbi:zinc-ribbon domain containing protein [Desulfallas sp. Bu1-1]|uniref:zinc-ribbon domain containing protein n=1 Tax=Desulfallas sp. Bu1-1 TaxID=2787620 RepID=UPI0018A0040D|nr:zinc-ribbon domain containing protein [Desulfallas sp. Bu1-1]MBF7083964.1 zinc-ribbon domain containing protein [Desulfallas sp. Bu1-1]
MVFSDKVLVCRDCGEKFTFTAGEQEFYFEKGFENAPARCPECRRARRQQNGLRSRGPRERKMYDVVCDGCGQMTTVPFEPNGSKPVYCQECYRSRRPNRSWA